MKCTAPQTFFSSCHATFQVTQKELEEQDLRLKKLHDLGEKLIGKVGEDSPSAEEIRKQLADFDDCWEQVAKRVIDGKERVSSQSAVAKWDPGRWF